MGGVQVLADDGQHSIVNNTRINKYKCVNIFCMVLNREYVFILNTYYIHNTHLILIHFIYNVKFHKT